MLIITHANRPSYEVFARCVVVHYLASFACNGGSASQWSKESLPCVKAMFCSRKSLHTSLTKMSCHAWVMKVIWKMFFWDIRNYFLFCAFDGCGKKFNHISFVIKLWYLHSAGRWRLLGAPVSCRLLHNDGAIIWCSSCSKSIIVVRAHSVGARPFVYVIFDNIHSTGRSFSRRGAVMPNTSISLSFGVWMFSVVLIHDKESPASRFIHARYSSSGFTSRRRSREWAILPVHPVMLKIHISES